MQRGSSTVERCLSKPSCGCVSDIDLSKNSCDGPAVELVQMLHALKLDRVFFTAHPQRGVPVWNKPTTAEQSSSTQFLEKFILQREPIDQHVCAPTLPVYREKTLVKSQYSSGDLNGEDPQIQFSLFYDMLLSRLLIQLHHVSHLPEERCKGPRSQCNPFVMLHLEPDRGENFQSEIISNSLHPVFNQRFQYGALPHDHIKFQTLVLRLYNSAQSNKAIGKACLPLSDVDLFGVIIQMKVILTEEMESNFQGDVLISLSYSPVTYKLSGTVHKATGLKKQDLLGKADPYVKLNVMFNGKKVYEWRSSIKHNTLSPVYNEVFSYQATEDMNVAMGTGSVLLTFYIFDFNYFSPDDTMGVVNIGKDVQSKSGREHWGEILQSPCQPVSNWHHIHSVQ